MTDKSPAVKVTKKKDGDDIITLSTGVRARLKPVATVLVEDAQSMVKRPRPPMWLNPQKDREEPNYNDPDYLDDMDQYNKDVSMAMLETALMFSVELVDGLPEDDDWIKRLKLLEKLGRIDLSAYDLDDPLEREFVYKRHVAVGADDYVRILNMSRLTAGEVDAQVEGFPGNT
jgi:hypothetical protein